MHVEPNDQAPAQPEPTLDDALSSAMDAGIEAATPEPAGEPPAVEAEPAGEQEPIATEGKEPATEPEGAPAEPTTPPEDDAAKEADTLGLKGKANERFRELTAEVKELAPLKEIKTALEAAGVKDVAELPKLVQNAKDGADLVEMVKETGATPDQFGQTLDYLGLLTKAGTGDRAAAEQAFELVQGEYLALAKALGREVPGVHDPLAEFADLQADIEKGDVTRARALEIAQARTAAKNAETARAQREADAGKQTAQQQAIEQGRASLNALEAKLQSDPHYAAKKPALIAKLGEIRQQFAPHQWAYAAELAYAAIPNPAPKVAPGPIRPGGPRPVMTPAAFDNPEDAMDAGIAAASVA